MQVTQEYIAGIREGRAILKAEGAGDIAARIRNLVSCVRFAGSQSPVGQFHRGELDFWRGQARKA